ncbi:MAG: NADP-dependent oxidoreductase [Gammaproteobacteria bacterium]|nr:NADP-dependent oxidoreductase [Gammaproteobacteria bacterium]
MKNTQVQLAKRPIGEPDASCFKIVQVDVPELQENQILIKVLWLSLDPYMRGRMHDVKSYAEPLQIGDVMTGESAGVVIQSTSPDFAVGDYVTAHQGWQTMLVADADSPAVMKVDLNNGTLSAHLGVVGMPGRTAYFGLLELGKPKAGETLVVAAASGAVGSVVGQIAKIKGLRAVGIAGGPEKCRYVLEELKFDDCIDYKSENWQQKLQEACPDGVDIYFENVGGDVTRAVAPLLNKGARVPVCGYISNYNDEDLTKSETPFHILKGLDPVPEHRFFVVTEWTDRWIQATRQLGTWVSEGKIKYRESIGEGIENAPELFRGMLKGKNFGKQLVKIADE